LARWDPRVPVKSSDETSDVGTVKNDNEIQAIFSTPRRYHFEKPKPIPS
jgi:hypothetical protein